jgi:hypothetical protein
MSAILSELRELSLLFRDHRMYSRRRTVPVRRAFNKLYKLLGLSTYLERRRLIATMPEARDFTIPENKGFVLWQPKSFPLLEQAIGEAKDLFDSADIEALKSKIPEDASFGAVPFTLRPDSAIAKLATDSRLLRPFAEYFGGVPLLHVVQLVYSPNDRKAQNSAQLFHLDGQDIKSLQVFVYLDDVTEENGPVTVLTATASERVAKALRYRKTPTTKRVDDDVVKRFMTDDSELEPMTGPAGSVCIFDGDRCFHFGSRKGTKPRRILHYEYVTPFAFTLPQPYWGRTLYAHLRRPDAPAWQRSVLGKP